MELSQEARGTGRAQMRFRGSRKEAARSVASECAARLTMPSSPRVYGGSLLREDLF
jgi:hypothetical protein